MATQKLLTPEQRKRYDQIRKNKGKDAADAYKQKVSGGSATPEGGTPSVPPVGDAIKNTDEILGPSLDWGRKIADEFYPSGTFQPITTSTSPEMGAFLGRLNDFAANAGNLSSLEQETIDLNRAALAGYNSPELQAMREQAGLELDRNLQAALYNQAKANARGGVRGGAAGAYAADLGIGRQQAGANMERDLIVKQAEEQQRRRDAFSNLVRQTEDARFGRKTAAEGMYGSVLGGEEAARTSREIYNRTGAMNEAATRSGLALGGAGTYAGTVSGQQGVGLNSEYLDFIAKEAEANRKAMMDLINADRNRLNNTYGSLGVP